jgi:hypothetical protein
MRLFKHERKSGARLIFHFGMILRKTAGITARSRPDKTERLAQVNMGRDVSDARDEHVD